MSEGMNPRGKNQTDRTQVVKVAEKKMKNLTEIKDILKAAESYTVINDGCVRYAVETAALDKWEEANGDISGDKYDDFCSDVPYIGKQLGTPGNREQNELCARLINRGADQRRF